MEWGDSMDANTIIISVIVAFIVIMTMLIFNFINNRDKLKAKERTNKALIEKGGIESSSELFSYEPESPISEPTSSDINQVDISNTVLNQLLDTILKAAWDYLNKKG